MHIVGDWSKIQVGDTLSKRSGFRTPGTKVTVVRRTPKYLHLSDGAKLHVEGICRDYEPWSDEREAKRARERDNHAAYCRFQRFVNSPLTAGATHLTVDDAVRDPTMLDELESMLTRQQVERAEFVNRIAAGRPKESK